MTFKFAVAAAALAATLSPAAASTIAYTISGVVIDGGDGTADALFGGGSLRNQVFTALETINTDNAPWSWANPDGSGAVGGSSMTGPGFINVALTIGGHTASFGDYSSNVATLRGSQVNSFIQSSSGLNKNDIGFRIVSPAIGADYTRANKIGGLSDASTGYYTLTDATGGQVVWANFAVTELSVAPATAISAVPLPSSAPLFGAALVALAGLGFKVGRRRAVAPS